MQEPEVRRLRPVLEAPLARLEDLREEVAKEWLLRVVEGASLDEIERLPTAKVARELPGLVSEIVQTVEDAPGRPGIDPDGSAYRLAAQLASLRGRETPEPAELALDVAALQSVMFDVLGRELADPESRALLKALNRLVSGFGALQAAAVEELIERRLSELESLANTDALTGLYNVRYMRRHLDHLLGVQQRYGHPFGLVLFDLDGLKRINDAFGHAAGDRALVAVAAAVRETVRGIDTPVRMGGDEFCVLAPNQTAPRAGVLGERLSAAIDALESGEGTAVSVSVGVVSCPEHGLDADRLLELADEAMYRAKASGERVALGAPEAVPEHRGDGARSG